MLNARFIFESIRHPRQMGTFVESPKRVGKLMARHINGVSNVIEFGAGTGSVTTQILEHLPGNGRLTCFEINPRLCDCLQKIEDPRLKIINSDAAKAEQYVDSFDCLVSSLPLAIFAKGQRASIFHTARKAGTYIQLQYTPLLAKQFEKYFTDVKLDSLLLSFPPAFVYVCRSPSK